MAVLIQYYALRNAVRRKGGVCTPHEVRNELQVYLSQFAPSLSAWGQKFWGEVMTREEYHALVNRRRKRKGSKITVDGKDKWELRQQTRLDGFEVEQETHDADLEWIDAFAARQDENQYNGEW